MTLPDKDHPIWSVARSFFIVIVLYLLLTFNYQNGFAPADITTIIVTIASLMSFDTIKKIIAPSS